MRAKSKNWGRCGGVGAIEEKKKKKERVEQYTRKDFELIGDWTEGW